MKLTLDNMRSGFCRICLNKVNPHEDPENPTYTWRFPAVKIIHKCWISNCQVCLAEATFWYTYKKLWKITISMGKSTINGPFSIATLNYQRLIH